MSIEIHRHFLELALKEAENALNEGTYPVGAVLVDENNEVMAVGRNQVYPQMDMTAHAEIDVIRSGGDAVIKSKDHNKKMTIYTSLEPCPMCTGAILFADITSVVWILNDDEGFGGFIKIRDTLIYDRKYKKLEMVEEPFEDLKEKQIELLKKWDEHPNNVRNVRKRLNSSSIG